MSNMSKAQEQIVSLAALIRASNPAATKTAIFEKLMAQVGEIMMDQDNHAKFLLLCKDAEAQLRTAERDSRTVLDKAASATA